MTFEDQVITSVTGWSEIDLISSIDKKLRDLAKYYHPRSITVQSVSHSVHASVWTAFVVANIEERNASQ